jgi:hypothetical protein
MFLKYAFDVTCDKLPAASKSKVGAGNESTIIITGDYNVANKLEAAASESTAITITNKSTKVNDKHPEGTVNKCKI